MQNGLMVEKVKENFMEPSSSALKELVIKMADDALIIGHRNSEWTGLGPILEEDIAFSSMAQDKIGHALALYTILHERLGGADPDHFAFLRKEKEYRCCHLVEWPIGDYAFSLIRHFLFDMAEAVRYESLAESSFEPFRLLSKKLKGELKYHLMHAIAWLVQLGNASEESHARMQKALWECYPLALGIFEPSKDFESSVAMEKIYPGEKILEQRWRERIDPILVKASLNLPDPSLHIPAYGGRQGIHTQHLQPLLEEMAGVFGLDPEAQW